MSSNISSNLNRKICILMLTPTLSVVSGMELRAKLNISKSLFSYHIKQLLASGFAKESFSDGCKFYELTEQGRVQILSEGLTPPLTGLHNIGFKFRILKQPTLSFGKPIAVANWTKYQGWFKDAYFYRSPAYLTIRPIPKGDRLPGTDPHKLRELARDKATVIAQELANRYDMKLGMAEDEAKGEWATLDVVAEHMEASVRTPDAIIDKSLGEGEIDFRNPEAAKEYLRLPYKVAQIEDTMSKMLALQEEGNKLLAGYGAALNIHIPALKGIVKITNRLDKILSQKKIGDFR